MKNKLIICMLIIISNLSCSSNKLDGLFEFKLGMSEESLKKVVDVTLLKERENKIGYEIVRNRLKVFHLDYYISENNELIKDITLSFFDNKLYSIHISKYNSAVEKLLTKDLGKPKIKREESKQPKNKNSTTSVMKDWKTNNKNIICWSYVDFFMTIQSLSIHLE